MPTATEPRRAGFSIRTGKNDFATKLARAIATSNRRMANARQNRIKVLREFAGPLVGEGVADGKQRPFSTLYSFITVLLPSIATGKIAVECNTRNAALRLPGREIALAIEKVIEDSRLVDELLGIVMDAICGFGVLKIGLEAAPGGRMDFADWRQDPGLPFGERISPDAYILGPCKKREAAPFEGDVYLMDREDAYGTEGMDHDVLDRLALFNDTQRAGAEKMTPGERDTDELFPQFELADVWLPKERMVVTVSPRPENAAGLIREVDGKDFPEGGPYEMLGYDYIPDNPLPMGCGLHMHDLHIMLNRIGRKYGRRIDNLKDVLLVTDPETGKVKEANDGDVMTVADANSGKVHSFGGNVVELGNAIGFLQDQQNRNGPNPELLGGMEADAKTLGQDQLKFATASKRISRMLTTTLRFLTRGIRQYGWYMWTDNARMFTGSEKVAGETITRVSRPGDRHVLDDRGNDRNVQMWADLGLALNEIGRASCRGRV